MGWATGGRERGGRAGSKWMKRPLGNCSRKSRLGGCSICRGDSVACLSSYGRLREPCPLPHHLVPHTQRASCGFCGSPVTVALLGKINLKESSAKNESKGPLPLLIYLCSREKPRGL